MEFHVSDVRQAASGGSYVVKFHAEVESADAESVVVEVISTVPEDADLELLRETVEYIRRGAESVLRPRGMGGRLRLHRLFIHDVDCRPALFERATAQGLATALAADASA